MRECDGPYNTVQDQDGALYLVLSRECFPPFCFPLDCAIQLALHSRIVLFHIATDLLIPLRILHSTTQSCLSLTYAPSVPVCKTALQLNHYWLPKHSFTFSCIHLYVYTCVLWQPIYGYTRCQSKSVSSVNFERDQASLEHGTLCFFLCHSKSKHSH